MTNTYKSKSKKNILWLLSTATLCFLAVSNSAYAQKKPAPDKLLAGKIYTIELAEQGKKAGDPEPDELTFKSDKFTSKVMKLDEKFLPSAYTAELDTTDAANKIITFETESKNAGEELLKWTGTITGEDIEGTAVWTNKKGKLKKEYTFTGTLKGKKKK